MKRVKFLAHDNRSTNRLIDKLQFYHLSNSRAQIVAYSKGTANIKGPMSFFLY